MKKIIAAALFIFCISHTNAQAPRFMYPDSLITAGLSPVPVHVAKNNNLKKLLMYRFSSPADSFLFRSFVYDTAGYLIKTNLHGPGGVVGNIDSLVYNTGHQLTEILSVTYQPYQVYYTGKYRYRNDVVELESNFMHSRLTGRAYETRYYDKNNHLVRHVSRMDGTKKKYEAVNKYRYDKEGFPESISVVNVNQFVTEKYIRSYHYTDERRKLIVYQKTVAGNTVVAECTYNALYQCTSTISYIGNITTVNDFFYHPNGILYEWNEKNNRRGTTSYRFYYE